MQRQRGRPGPHPAEPAGRAPRAGSLGRWSSAGPQRDGAWRAPGLRQSPARSRRSGASPCSPAPPAGTRHLRLRRPRPAFPRLLSPASGPRPASVLVARRGCARAAPGGGQGSARSGRRRRELSGCRRRRRRLRQQVSIKVLVRSLFPHSRRAQRRLQLFQNTRPVPQPPPPPYRPGRVESRGAGRPRGRWLPTFRRDPPVARLWVADPLP